MHSSAPAYFDNKQKEKGNSSVCLAVSITKIITVYWRKRYIKAYSLGNSFMTISPMEVCIVASSGSLLGAVEPCTGQDLEQKDLI